jgi:hypothetical protein
MDLGSILPLARKQKQGLPESISGSEHGTKKPGKSVAGTIHAHAIASLHGEALIDEAMSLELKECVGCTYMHTYSCMNVYGTGYLVTRRKPSVLVMAVVTFLCKLY